MPWLWQVSQNQLFIGYYIIKRRCKIILYFLEVLKFHMNFSLSLSKIKLYMFSFFRLPNCKWCLINPMKWKKKIQKQQGNSMRHLYIRRSGPHSGPSSILQNTTLGSLDWRNFTHLMQENGGRFMDSWKVYNIHICKCSD